MTEEQDAKIREFIPELIAAMAPEIDAPGLLKDVFPRIDIDRSDGLLITIHTPTPKVVEPGDPPHERLKRLREGLERITGVQPVRVRIVDLTQQSASSDEARDLMKCSFCGKSQKDVLKLIAGPGVYICNECIALCNDILQEENPGVRIKTDLRPVANLETPGVLEELRRSAGIIEPVEAHVNEVVSVLRGRGVSWAQIGEALGMSRQGAWSRFSGEE